MRIGQTLPGRAIKIAHVKKKKKTKFLKVDGVLGEGGWACGWSTEGGSCIGQGRQEMGGRVFMRLGCFWVVKRFVSAAGVFTGSEKEKREAAKGGAL